MKSDISLLFPVTDPPWSRPPGTVGRVPPKLGRSTVVPPFGSVRRRRSVSDLVSKTSHKSLRIHPETQDQDFIISMVGSKMLEISRLASKIPDSITIVLD